MKTDDEKFMVAVDTFCKGMARFIKQLMRVNLIIERKGTSGILKNGMTEKLLMMHRHIVQERLNKVSLLYGLQSTAEELAKKELLQLSYLFDSSYTRIIKQPNYEMIYGNIAVQYCIYEAIVRNMNGVYDGDFTQYIEDAFQETFFMISGLIKPFFKEKKEEEMDNDSFWKFIMYLKKTLPSKLRHWYLTKIKHFKYNRKAIEKKKRYEKVKIESFDSKKQGKIKKIHTTHTLADKYGGRILEQSYDTLINLVSETNAQYAEYMHKHFYEGKTYHEIAVEYATKLGTVKSGVSRGINYLRKRFIS
ncbi:hypothetical protein [Niallia sp.]|uniref:hypothetical protein n=1 Tax=Niallia sp. TaxID=2837523 RepID=UPI0028973775|nr:hypothetical protein [Niallia sp.]